MIYGHIPVLSKHDRNFYNWFIFGSSSDGRVDVADQNGDVAVNVTQEQAKAIIEARDVFIASVEKIVSEFT